MLIVRKAYPDDFEKIYDLLKDYWNPTQVPKETWKQIFIKQWDSPEDYYGYFITDQDKVVGFVSTIFSKRIINAQEYNFCNLSSWVVREGYRDKKLLLQYPLLELENYTITILSATERTAKLNKKLGYNLLDNYQKLVFPVPTSRSWFLDKTAGFRVWFDQQEIMPQLNHNELIIFNDHQKFNCTHILISTNKGNCYAILKNKTLHYKNIKMPFARVDYLSNRDIFFEYFDRLKVIICWKLRVAGLIIYERFLPKRKLPYSINVPICSTLYKSDLLGPEDIDNVYSEFYLLNM